MPRFSLVLTLLALPCVVGAKDLDEILDEHVLLRYKSLEVTTEALADAAALDCDPSNTELQDRFHQAFDAWIGVSHIRFGPSEANDRAFALNFWPDPRGSTPKALTKLIAEEDPIVGDPDTFRAVSIAARGFFALEFMLYGPSFRELGSASYRCDLIQAMTQDMATTSQAIYDDWKTNYGALVRAAGSNGVFRSEDEALRQFFTSLTTGLEFTSDVRLGRPMGTFDRPRPNRAEARRSGRPLHNVILSLHSTQELAALLSEGDADLEKAFEDALERASTLEDPLLAGVAEPQGRFRIEVLQQSIDQIREMIAQDLGPSLGVAAGFNSLDGD